MKSVQSIYWILGIFLNSIAFSQQGKTDSTYFEDIDSVSGVFRLKLEEANPQICLEHIKKFYHLTAADNFVIKKKNIDKLGKEHIKMGHYHNGIQVYGSSLIMHSNQRGVYLLTAKLAANFNPTDKKLISEKEIIPLALQAQPAELYRWQNNDEEENLKRIKDDPNATYYPQPELMYYPFRSSYVLVYRVLVSSEIPFSSNYVLLSAEDGRFLQKKSALQRCTHSNHTNETCVENNFTAPTDVTACTGGCHAGSGSTLFYGPQNFNTSKHSFTGNCKYYLHDQCGYTQIHTSSRTKVSSNSEIFSRFEYTDEDNDFAFLPSRPGATAHWSLLMTVNYYDLIHDRDGYSNFGGTINAYCNSDGIGNNNAYYDPGDGTLNFGSGDPALTANAMVTLDWVGHEYTHGVSFVEVEFETDGEPGALNESFSDILGTMVEHHAKSNFSTGSGFSYIFGQENVYHLPITTGGVTVFPDRNMQNPSSSLIPDTYNGTFFWDPTDLSYDDGGVHVNCGIQDFWFYLLAEGGSGMNDLGNNYCVNALGKETAADIVYHSLCNFLPANTPQYTDARTASIAAAIDLFGANSKEVAEVTSAWYAVGVGPKYTGTIHIENITVSGPYGIHYNNKVKLEDVKVIGGLFDVSSNVEIELVNPISMFNGSSAALYIAPACSGGARPIQQINPIESDILISEDFTSSRTRVPDFYITPNPNNGRFSMNLNIENELPQQIVIVDLLGREVMRIDNPSSYEQEIIIPENQSGLFVLNLKYGNEFVSQRILVQK